MMNRKPFNGWVDIWCLLLKRDKMFFDEMGGRGGKGQFLSHLNWQPNCHDDIHVLLKVTFGPFSGE